MTRWKAWCHNDLGNVTLLRADLVATLFHIAALERLLDSPSVVVISPGGRYLRLFAELVRAGDARGNIAFDAQIAAVCREHRVTRLLTLDRDFSRFSGPALMSPLDPID